MRVASMRRFAVAADLGPSFESFFKKKPRATELDDALKVDEHAVAPANDAPDVPSSKAPMFATLKFCSYVSVPK